MSKLSNIALRKIAGFSDRPKKSNKSAIDLYIDAELRGVDPKEAEEIKREVKQGMFDIAQERGMSPVNIVRRRINIVRKQREMQNPGTKEGKEAHNPYTKVKPKELPSLFSKDFLQRVAEETRKRNAAAAEETRKRNTDAAWSYGGATVGGGALGALIGGEGNRLKGALIGMLLANAANYGRRKWKYGNSVIA